MGGVKRRRVEARRAERALPAAVRFERNVQKIVDWALAGRQDTREIGEELAVEGQAVAAAIVLAMRPVIVEPVLEDVR